MWDSIKGSVILRLAGHEQGKKQKTSPVLETVKEEGAGDQDSLHHHGEEEEGERDPERGVQHTKYFALGGERSLLAVPAGRLDIQNISCITFHREATSHPIVVMTVPAKKKDWPKFQFGTLAEESWTPRRLSAVTEDTYESRADSVIQLLGKQ